MYLLVVTMLIIGVLGTYIQVVALQTSRAFSTQSAVASAMMQWHSTALGQAEYVIPPAEFTTDGLSGCYMPSAIGATGTAVICNDGAGGNVYIATGDVAGGSSYPACSTNAIPGSGPGSFPGGVEECQYYLPSGYNVGLYQFKSLAYQSATGQNYVITYLDPPANPNSFLSFAWGGKSVGITNGDLINQMRASGMQPMYWGTVQSVSGVTEIVTEYFINNGVTTTPQWYPAPTPAPAVGTVVLVSQPATLGCPSGSPRNATTGVCP